MPQVDPICIRSDIDVLAANARSAFCLATKEFGDVLFVAIGALEVGTVNQEDDAIDLGEVITPEATSW